MVRDVKKEDFESHRRVAALSYIWPYEKGSEEFREANRLGSFDDAHGELTAVLSYDVHDAYLCGSTVKTAAIGGVASLPERRRGGMVRKLFEELERRAEAENWVLGVLYPFAEGYYKKFGFDNVQRCFDYEADFSALSDFERCTAAKLCESDDDWALLAKLYSRFAAGYNLMFRRSAKQSFCTEPLKQCRYVYMHLDSFGEADAYADFHFEGDEKVLTVEELGYLTPEALRGMIGFLRNYDGISQRIKFCRLPMDSPLPRMLERYNSRLPVAVNYRAAARIYNLEEFLKSIKYPRPSGSFSIKSTDSIERNSGVFKVSFADGKAKVERSDTGEADIELTPAAAAYIFLSGEGFDARRLRYIDGVVLHNDDTDLFAVLPLGEPMICDNF